MTIEYTYPEQKPTGANVTGITGRSYRLWRDAEGLIRGAAGTHPDDVPLICEAAMTLAGHEWPVKAVYSAPNEDVLRAAAERIIARLEKYRASHHPIQDDFTDGLVAAYRTAEQLVREEYGL